MPQDFTPAELQQVARDGFVIRERAFNAVEVAEIIDACEELVQALIKDRRKKRFHVGSYTFDHSRVNHVTVKWEGDTDIVHGIEPFAHVSPVLEKWGYDARFVDPMKHLVGDPTPELFTEKLNLKRPFHGGVNPLHQDYPYWADGSKDATRIATAMLFLDDADQANGCMEVLPGSHLRGKWPTRTDTDQFGQNEMDPKAAEGLELVPVEVPAGTVLYFGSFLVHRSSPNRSARERRALLYSYQPAGWPTSVEMTRKVFGEKPAQ
jgi:ectoine hydroxylase